MRSRSFVALCALALLTASTAYAQQPPANRPATPPPPPAVKVGEPAPDFTLAYLAKKTDGGYENKLVKLSDYKGKQNVVLAFFPAAFSPGCTSEMEKYQQHNGRFNAANTTVLGISVDSTWSNKAFREQLGAEFPILSDWKKETSRKYGLLNEDNGFARRATFVVDQAGIVQKVDLGSEALDPSGVVGMCEKLKK